MIGLIHQGERHVFHFGDHPIQQRVQPEEVIFEIGSISKVFTTSILASMIQKGQMKLDDSISLYYPEIRKNHPSNWNSWQPIRLDFLHIVFSEIYN